MVWKTTKIMTDIDFISVDESDFLAARTLAFRSYDKDLTDIGFSVSGSSVVIDDQLKTHFRLYWSDELKMAAMVVHMVNQAAQEMTYLEIIQQYEDICINVSNSTVPEAYPKMYFKLAFRYPKIQSAEEMIKILRNITSQKKPHSKPIDLNAKNGFSEISKFFRKESDELLRLGLVKHKIDENGRRSLTLKGAFLMTFRIASPCKNLFEYISNKEAKKYYKNV